MKIKIQPSTVFKIPLEDGFHTYARELQRPYKAMYDARTKEPIDIEQIVQKPCLFIVPVFDECYERWEEIGCMPLDDGELLIPDQFIQDNGFPKQFTLLDKDGNSRPATREEIEGLERAAVWPSENVEERINDHYAGRRNRTFEMLRPYPPLDLPPDYYVQTYKDMLEPVVMSLGFELQYDSSLDYPEIPKAYLDYKYARSSRKIRALTIHLQIMHDHYWLRVDTNKGRLRVVADYPNPDPNADNYAESHWVFRNQNELVVALEDIGKALEIAIKKHK